MAKYVLIVQGRNIFLDGVSEQVATGFVTLRSVKAKNEEDAIRIGQIGILKDWKLLFNRENKAGTPSLNIRSVKRIRNPFRKFILPSDFLFYSNEEEKITAFDTVDAVVR